MEAGILPAVPRKGHEPGRVSEPGNCRLPDAIARLYETGATRESRNQMMPIRTTIALCLLAASLAPPAYAQFEPAPGGLNQAAAPQREFARPSPSPWDRAPGSSPWDSAPGPQPQAAPAPMSAPAGPSPFDRPGQAQMPPCMNEFAPLRDDTEKKAKAVQAASKRKPSPQEACRLFNALVGAQDKMNKFVAAKGASCGIPKEVGEQIKRALTQTDQVRARVCEAAARGPAPSGPSLSEALGTSRLADPSNIKRGGGTFDTLTGTPLGGSR
jgi:hypothetical protein